jgi:hypothetical protein
MRRVVFFFVDVLPPPSGFHPPSFWHGLKKVKFLQAKNAALLTFFLGRAGEWAGETSGADGRTKKKPDAACYKCMAIPEASGGGKFPRRTGRRDAFFCEK